MKNKLKLIYPTKFNLPKVIHISIGDMHFFDKPSEPERERVYRFPDSSGEKNMGYAILRACKYEGKVFFHERKNHNKSHSYLDFGQKKSPR